ncbi:MAG TPA: hypothetical protein PKG54_08205 [Phycisphaerae bacterium]|jgi:hypothetical protein|nr:hypothetical protein [Phycisphaerae bacterium]HOB74494.1 hypothetical protein [Phycisphaerae bacterium]HOJ56803.1 hypothetical protein [Phycisphaerae bacterium]HOL28545.1 hypothetical protein [Phycisphaerae bacterium]HPP23061.1 hypothetical protein [Phycisphaerae bacterium]
MSLPDLDFMALIQTWMAGLMRASWQGGVVIAVVWILCRLLRRLPPRGLLLAVAAGVGENPADSPLARCH